MQLKHKATIPLSLSEEDYLLTAATTSTSSRRRGSRAVTPLRVSLRSDVHNHAKKCDVFKDQGRSLSHGVKMASLGPGTLSFLSLYPYRPTTKCL